MNEVVDFGCVAECREATSSRKSGHRWSQIENFRPMKGSKYKLYIFSLSACSLCKEVYLFVLSCSVSGSLLLYQREFNYLAKMYVFPKAENSEWHPNVNRGRKYARYIIMHGYIIFFRS